MAAAAAATPGLGPLQLQVRRQHLHMTSLQQNYSSRVFEHPSDILSHNLPFAFHAGVMSLGMNPLTRLLSEYKNHTELTNGPLTPGFVCPEDRNTDCQG